MDYTCVLILCLFLYTVEGYTEQLSTSCCNKGKQWFVDSRETCGQYSQSIAGIDDKDQDWCLSLLHVCCLQEKQSNQCQRGLQHARIRGTCDALHSQRGTEHVRECCHCCRLGLLVRQSGIACTDVENNIQGSVDSECLEVLVTCCVGDGVPTTQPTTLLPAPTLGMGICARFPGQLCAQDCVDTSDGSYRCACFDGFALHSDGRTCVQNNAGDRCGINNPCQHRCIDTGVAILCQCFDGYILQSDGRTCADLDECIMKTHTCTESQHCVNTPGSFTCEGQPNMGDDTAAFGTCTTGYAYNPYSGTCEDINECTIGLSPCQYSQRCINSLGSYRCMDQSISDQAAADCSIGFQYNINSQRCEDINECGMNQDTCLVGQQCENTIGSYVCRRAINCGTGYTLDKESQRCIDDDECILGTHNCGVGRECRNIPGSFHCVTKTCPTGYRLNFSNGLCEQVICNRGMRADRAGNCIDINECTEQPTVCRTNQECRNTIGSYTCRNLISCGPGFELNPSGSNCIDIDECTRGTHDCNGHLQTCINRPGTYLCQCPEGYQMNHRLRICEDINECERFGGQVCSQNANCENTDGSFRCTCMDGFQSEDDGRTCKDVDECSVQNMCEHTCRNTWGSFHCTCYDGYQLREDSRSCEDIDECQVWQERGGSLCIGVCQNTQGSYECSCPTGYTMMADSRTCRDVDECSIGTANCDGEDNYCINTRGNFKCETVTCPSGFVKAPALGNRNNNVRCQRQTFVCPQGDTECLYAPVSYSVNFITFPSKIRVPADLFTMRGPLSPQRRLEFSLKINSAHAPGVTPVTREYFNLNTVATNEVVIQLLRQIEGPQDIELQLDMNIYSKEFRRHSGKEVFFGTAVAKIKVFVTSDICLGEDPWANYRERYRHYGLSSLVPKPPQVFQTEDTGVLCLKMECQLVDIDCIMNRTLSIQYQHLSIPSIRTLEYGPLVLINIQPKASLPFPNLDFTIEGRRRGGYFDILVDPTLYNSGSLRLIKPITGPRAIHLRLRIDNKNRFNTVVSSHYALVTIYVSAETF